METKAEAGTVGVEVPVGRTNCGPFFVGDRVDVEWMPGEFWRGGVLTDFDQTCAEVRLPSGWHVRPSVSHLRWPNDGLSGPSERSS